MPADFTSNLLRRNTVGYPFQCRTAEIYKWKELSSFFWLKLLDYSRRAGGSGGLAEYYQEDSVLCQVPRIEQAMHRNCPLFSAGRNYLAMP